MLCVKVPIKEAQKAKENLLMKGLFDKEHFIKKDKEFVYFPVKKRFRTKYKIIHKLLKKKKPKSNLKGSLAKKLGKRELDLVRTAMDVIGNIAILEIPKELEKKENLIAKQVLSTNKSINTVLKKGKHRGVYRTQNLKYLAGEKTREAEYRENNVTLKLDVEKVYFSPRLSNERKRIYKQVKKGEDVLVMFAGAGPYTCVIAKNTNAKHITGVEINPEAHNYSLQNVIANKLNNTSVFLGDVKNIVPKLNKKFDRILMPLPKTAANYLDVALKASKKGTVIHFYDFQKETETKKSTDKIKKACAEARKKCRIIQTVKCGQAAPREFRFCIEFKVL